MIHVHEPFGERALNLPVRIGGDRLCNVLVPGAKDAERVTIDHQEDVLRIRIDGDVPVRVNNGWMAPGAFRELLLGDVIFLGSARVQLRDVGLEPTDLFDELRRVDARGAQHGQAARGGEGA
ncbi:MAG: hypothetical protein EBR51_09725, partial [Gammaproteobacteria bacterium]|nr:hypothetical protein [Gammaproteobacteria bacterium]